MPNRISDKEFIEVTRNSATFTDACRTLNLEYNNFTRRRRRIEKRYDIKLTTTSPNSPDRFPDTNPARICQNIDDGVIIVGSDAHYFPGSITPAHKAFVKLCRELNPRVVVMNGDIFDGSTISRYPRIGWDDKPTVKDELKACQERLQEITEAAPNATYVWPLGNHDARFETRLAAVASEFEGIDGFSLKHYFPEWKPCWSYFVNDNTVIKHRFKGGIHATHNNVLWSGRTMVTGHLHSLKVTPFSDYNGTRYGVDTGTLADVDGEQFVDYTEDNPKNWRSGAVVLTYHHGILLPPELCEVTNVGAVFRGQIL